MKKKICSILLGIMLVLSILGLVACGEKSPNGEQGGNENYIPTKTVADIESKLGNNYEIVLKISGTDASEGSEVINLTAIIKKANDYVFYSFYEGNNTESFEKYLLKGENLYLYSSQSNKYVKLPGVGKQDAEELYFIGYGTLLEYSTLKNYPYTSVSDVRVAGRDCKQYEY